MAVLDIGTQGDSMKNHEPTQEGLKAIQAVVKARGFDAMADEFMSRPEYRDRIVNVQVNDMRRNGLEREARKFNALAQHVLHGTQVFA